MNDNAASCIMTIAVFVFIGFMAWLGRQER